MLVLIRNKCHFSFIYFPCAYILGGQVHRGVGAAHPEGEDCGHQRRGRYLLRRLYLAVYVRLFPIFYFLFFEVNVFIINVITLGHEVPFLFFDAYIPCNSY